MDVTATYFTWARPDRRKVQQQDYSRRSDWLITGEPPKVEWPNGARVAVQFVLNYEEGGENHVEHGDAGSEQFLSDIIGAASFPDKHMSMDSMYEYGSRAGFSRIHQEFQKRQLPMTIFGVGMALARNPYIVEAIKACNYDVVSHGATLATLSKYAMRTRTPTYGSSY